MPDNFSRPEPQRQKIAPTVDLKEADGERREKYGTLEKMKEGLPTQGEVREIAPENRTENIPFPDHPAKGTPVRAPEIEEDRETMRQVLRPKDDPTDEDRRTFMRSVLAGKRYKRIYKLFGGEMSATLEDRSTTETELMYATLEADKPSENDGDMLLERYQLALQLRSVDLKGQSPAYQAGTLEEGTEPAQQEAMRERVTQIMKLPKPTYQALMEVVRRFEDHVAYLTERALDTDFWKAGGGA